MILLSIVSKESTKNNFTLLKLTAFIEKLSIRQPEHLIQLVWISGQYRSEEVLELYFLFPSPFHFFPLSFFLPVPIPFQSFHFSFSSPLPSF